mmetsp:Transcript_13415/g.29597  ORF Transcript_13415/g.29597 Transcript_13415/m.29597 type:complete len:126 (-) Transcript_13415:423-800(-)
MQSTYLVWVLPFSEDLKNNHLGPPYPGSSKNAPSTFKTLERSYEKHFPFEKNHIYLTGDAHSMSTCCSNFVFGNTLQRCLVGLSPGGSFLLFLLDVTFLTLSECSAARSNRDEEKLNRLNAFSPM